MHLVMDRELFIRVANYHKSVDPNRPAIDTLRELLWIAVTGDVQTGVTAAARKMAVARTQAHILSVFTVLVNDVIRGLEATGVEADASAFAEAVLAARSARGE
jgi:hypothetical protein